jgi:integrase
MMSIQDFIAELRTKSTKATYQAGIYAFLDWKYGKQRIGRCISKDEMPKYEGLASDYLSKKNNYAEDLRHYAASMQDIAPTTARARMSGIKEYLFFNDIEFSEKNKRQIKSRMPKGGARTVERDLDHNTLQIILNHSDVKGRALILTLASSGMRIGECLQLRVSDINFAVVPAEVNIRQEITKTRRTRVTFLSREAVAALREWLKVRAAYLGSAQNRNAGFIAQGIGSVKSASDPRLFPFDSHVAQQMWRTALKNAGLLSADESTRRQQLHYHQLRKFFRSQLALTCPVDIVEALMGHEGYLTAAYRRYTREQMAEYYLKSEGMVTLQIPSKEITRVETEIKKEMQDQQAVISRLVVQMAERDSELNALKKIILFSEEKKR